MNKREVIWLIIRLIGVYFAYSTLVSALGLFGSIYNYASLPAPAAPTPRTANTTRPTPPPGITLPEVENPVKTEANAPADKARSEAFKLIFWFVLLTGLYGVAAWYLIRDGKYLFAILNREEKGGDEKESPPEVTSLNL